MEQEIEGKGAEIKEGCYQSPVLLMSLSSTYSGLKIQEAHLILHENSPEAVKELEWRDDMTLNEYRCNDGSGGPVTCTGGHLIEPLF